MAETSVLVIGTVHFHTYGKDKDGLFNCISRIVDKKIEYKRNNYFYTICDLQIIEQGKIIYGKMLKMTEKAKGESFDRVSWRTIEKDVGSSQVTASSRFLLTSDEVIIVEDKKPVLSRTTFAAILKELMTQATDESIYQLSIAYHRESTKVRDFIESSSQITRIVVRDVKIQNPTLTKRKIIAAREMMTENNIKTIKFENKVEGLNKGGPLVEAVVELSEEGQAELEVQGIHGEHDKKLVEKTKIIEIKKRIGDMASFISVAKNILTEHMKRFHQE